MLKKLHKDIKGLSIKRRNLLVSKIHLMTLKSSKNNYKLKSNSFKDLINIDLESLNLILIERENIFLYESKGYKLLNFHINPKVYFDIAFEDKNNCIIKLKRIEIDEIKSLLNIFKINIDIRINKRKKFIYIERNLSIKVLQGKYLFNFVPYVALNKLLPNLLELITNRFDKKFKLKMTLAKYKWIK